MQDNRSPERRHDILNGAVMAVILIVGTADIIRYIMLGMAVPLATVCILEILFAILAYTSWRTGLSCLLLPVAAAGFVLFYTTNNFETTMFNAGFLIQAAAAAFGTVVGTIGLIRKKYPLRKPPTPEILAGTLVAVLVLGAWYGNVSVSKGMEEMARKSIWAVPEQYDSEECSRPGTVEKLTYETKAYATDERAVEKTAYVYLPYGYNESQSYNILYLMHGTGDDEEYWLKTHPQNKTMVDQMIARGDIEPLIIVTPTFYVENDCMDGLDPLTYSFKDELRNDLMPAVESKYSTYAESCDDAGFTASRDHRAFAGLSRGAVTMYHSALCGSLDYFSWFGAFSGSRTTAEYFQETIQSEAFAEYPINYLYVSSGNFDFALPGQIQDYEALTAMEPRLTEGVNTSFDVYPMRYHSIRSWHLALYNFLQKIF